MVKALIQVLLEPEPRAISRVMNGMNWFLGGGVYTNRYNLSALYSVNGVTQSSALAL